MITAEEIVERYNEFNSFLHSVNLVDLQKTYNRQELSELASNISTYRLRSLSVEISNMVKEIKQQEFPELLGVHHFPVLRKIDFLPEDQKIALDKFLVTFRVGNYVSGLWKITRNETKVKQVLGFLVQNKVIQEKYFGYCPYCHDSYVTRQLEKEQKEKIDFALSLNPNNDERYDILSELLLVDAICHECENALDLETLKKLEYKNVFLMAMQRDRSLDNV